MNCSGNMLWLLVLLPVLGAGVSRLMPSPRATLNVVAVGVPARIKRSRLEGQEKSASLREERFLLEKIAQITVKTH